MALNTTMKWESLSDRPTVPKRGIFMDIIGIEGSGKSSLAMTLGRSGGVGYIDIDQSADRARRPDDRKARDRIKIVSVSYPVGMTEKIVIEECRKAWSHTLSMIREASAGWATGGIVLDTGTEAWELRRLAAFGTLTPKGRTDTLYGPVNASFRNTMRSVYRDDHRHLITIHQMREEWKDKIVNGQKIGIKTGRMVRTGFKEIPYMSDIIVQCERDKGEFKATVVLCKLSPNGPSMEGMELADDQLDFAEIVGMATDTEPDQWRRKGK